MSGPGSDLAQEWLERARSDLILGQAALRTPGVFREDACFHAQQCAEKALKALLLKLGIALQTRSPYRIAFGYRTPSANPPGQETFTPQSGAALDQGYSSACLTNPARTGLA